MNSAKLATIGYFSISIAVVTVLMMPLPGLAKNILNDGGRIQGKSDVSVIATGRTENVGAKASVQKKSNHRERARRIVRKMYDWRRINPLHANRFMKFLGLALVGVTVKSHTGNF